MKQDQIMHARLFLRRWLLINILMAILIISIGYAKGFRSPDAHPAKNKFWAMR
jgi:hypothetical protein